MGGALLPTLALAAGYGLDLLIGDPRCLPHPVRLLGAAITFAEKKARRLCRSPAALKAAGALIVLVCAGGSAILVFLLLGAAFSLHWAAGLALQTYLIFTVLAGGDLRNHVQQVREALEGGDLGKARSKTALLVSRDTANLEEGGLARASLESLFENSSDGLVAPLFFLVLGGPAAAVFYKAVNTLDSMLGYKSEEYLYIGYFAAKLDDLLNYIPARLTALIILLAGPGGESSRRARRILAEDRRKHESPNSAWPEAAAAGVLDIRLGGADRYRGVLKERPLINPGGREVVAADIGRGLKLFQRLSLVAFTISVAVAWVLRYREVATF